MADLAYSLFKLLEKDNISFIYQGDFTNPILGMATDLIKNHANDEVGFRKLRNKLSFLMIESFQNIVRYADSHRANELNLADELFITRNIGDLFYIATSNIVENEKVGIVKGKLDSINNLDKKELKDLYVKILRNKQLTEQGGAGLGFIEMVRKSNEKIDFDFEQINEELSIFYFQLKIKSKLIENLDKESLISIDETKTMHKIISEEKIVLIHKGFFEESSVITILSMAEDNVRDESMKQRRQLYHVMVEILQNISKHSHKNKDDEKEGIFVLAEKNGNFIVSGGNFIKNSDLKGLKKYLINLSKMSKDDLNILYKKILRGDGIPDNITGGLGFIDLFRVAKQPVDFLFTEINNELSFYTIKVVI